MTRNVNFGRRVFRHGLVFATAILTCAAVQADHNDTHGDKAGKFLHKALQGGQMEVQMGQLAQQKAQSQEVKNLGSTLVRDHTQANQQLQQLASTKNVQAESHEKGEHQDKHDKMLSKLQNQSGAEFDKAFVRMAIRDHKKDISEFEKARTDLNDPEIRSFIDQTLPKLRQHLQMAESAARAVGVDAATVASERDEDADTAAGAAAGAVSGSSEKSSRTDKDRHSSLELDRNQDRLNGATESDSSGTVKQNNPSASVEGNVGDHEIKANADVDRSDKSVTVDTSSEKSHKIFQKGDGKILGLPTDKNDGKFLGIIPDPKKRHHEADVNVNSDSDSTSVGSSASSERGSSSSSSSSRSTESDSSK